MQVLMDPAFRKAAEEGDVMRLNMLIAANPDMVHSVTPDELNTALHIAASNGHVQFIHRILRYTNNDAKLIVTENSDGDTPLHLALRAGHLVVVEHLILYAARATKNLKESLTLRNKKGNTLLHEAASNGHVRFIQHVLRDTKIDVGIIVSVNSDGDTPLHLAVRAGHLEVVEHLTRYAAHASNVQNFKESLTVRNKKRNTLLHEAASNGHVRFIQRVIRDTKIDVGLIVSVNSDGDTPLHLAVRAGHLEVVENLTWYAAKARYAAEASNVQNFEEPLIMQNKKGNTPLHEAVIHGMYRVAVTLLLAGKEVALAGATLEATITKHGEGADKVEAIIAKHGEGARMIDVLPILRNADGRTPLHLAVKRRSFEMIEMLITCDQVMERERTWKYTQIRRKREDPALTEAAGKGDVLNLVKLLADSPSKESLTVRNFEGNTLLHVAASNGHVWCVHHVLLYMNIDVGLIVSVNSDEDTPLHLAVSAGHLEVVEHLIQYATWARNIQENLKEPLIMQNRKGNTPLHEAVIHGMYRVAVKLLQAAKEVALAGGTLEATIAKHGEGANEVVRMIDLLPILRNADGHTPLHLAVKGRSFEMIEMLITCDEVMERERTWKYTQAPIIMANKEGNTPLHEAVTHRMSDVALMLLEANPRCANTRNKKMHSPLYIAAREDLVDLVKKIVDQGLTPSSVSTHGTALHQAVLADNIRALEKLLNTCVELVELTDSSGNNALHYAAQNNKASMVSMLLNNSSTLAYKQNNEQHTPLHVAAIYGSEEAAQELLKQYPDVIQTVDIVGRNALHIAIIKDKVNMLELLLKYVLSEEIVNEQDRDGNTPLHVAAKLHLEQPTAVLLRDRRVNPYVLNHDGRTALTYQIPRERMDPALAGAASEGDVLNLIELVARNPYTVYSVTSEEENTALHIAASKGHDRFVHHVLLYMNMNAGIIVTQNSDGDTPLHLAVIAGHLEVVEQLIRYTAWAREIEANLKEPLIIQNKKGNTWLHEAAKQGMYRVAVNLLEHANDVTCRTPEEIIKDYDEYVMSVNDVLLLIRNGDGDTLLHLAVRGGNLEFVDMLISRAKGMKAEFTTTYVKGPIIMANREGNTPLHEAVLHRLPDIAIKLLEANPTCGHMSNANMQSPLYIAARDRLTQVVRKIVNQGLSVASISTYGSALHQCVLGDHIRALDILVNKYAQLLDFRDSSGNNALHYAVQTNNSNMVSILLNKKSTLAYWHNNDQLTPLHMAVMYGSMEAGKELLRQCPDVIETVDSMGRNAFHIAIINDKGYMLELLLKYVLPEEIVNRQDKDGNTPLHHAAMLMKIQPAWLLLNDPRVNPCLVNRDGHTAFALSGRGGILGMSTDEMNLWKELKRHESKRCKQQRVTTPQFRPRWQRGPYIELSVETYVIVATLMAMATFAATLTMPGGYSRQSGTAIVGHHLAFKIFVVCNTLSMCGSTVLVLCFIWRWRDPMKAKLSILIWAHRLIVLCGLAMIISMLTAVYLTIAPESQWVAYVAVAIGASTPFLVCLILRKRVLILLPTNWWVGMGDE